MKKFLVRRAMTAVITLLAVTVLVFILARMTGDPRVLLLGDQTQTSQEQWDAWGRDFGLDKPLVIQYVIYLGKLVRGDLGDSILQRRSVTELMWQRMPNSAQLAVVAFAFSIIIGIPLGILSAVTRGSAWDYISRSFAMFGHAAPSFWVGIVLIFIFAVGVESQLRAVRHQDRLVPDVAQGGGPEIVHPPGSNAGLGLGRGSVEAHEVLDAGGAGRGVHQAGPR